MINNVSSNTVRETVSFVLRLVAAAAVGLYVMRKLVHIMDPTDEQKKKSKLTVKFFYLSFHNVH